MNLDPEIQTLFDDAVVNYENSRYKDATKGFKYLMRRSIKKDDFPHYLYFTYRASLSSYVNSDILETAKILHEAGMDILKLTTKLIIPELECTSDLREKSDYLYLLQSILGALNKTEERENVVSTLINTYIEIAEEFDIKLKEKIKYLEKGLKLLNELNVDQDSDDIAKMLASTYIKQAELKSEVESEQYQSTYLYQKAKYIYESLGMDKKVELCKMKIEN